MVSLIKRAAKKLRKIRKTFAFTSPQTHTHTTLSHHLLLFSPLYIVSIHPALLSPPFFLIPATNERTNERKKKAKNFHEEMLQRIKCRPTENKFFFRTIPTSPQPLIDFRFSFFFPYNIIYFTNFCKSIISRSMM
jgi:hypothetical protein